MANPLPSMALGELLAMFGATGTSLAKLEHTAFDLGTLPETTWQNNASF
jgi:hypothetical protein